MQVVIEVSDSGHATVGSAPHTFHSRSARRASLLFEASVPSSNDGQHSRTRTPSRFPGLPAFDHTEAP